MSLYEFLQESFPSADVRADRHMIEVTRVVDGDYGTSVTVEHDELSGYYLIRSNGNSVDIVNRFKVPSVVRLFLSL